MLPLLNRAPIRINTFVQASADTRHYPTRSFKAVCCKQQCKLVLHLEYILGDFPRGLVSRHVPYRSSFTANKVYWGVNTPPPPPPPRVLINHTKRVFLSFICCLLPRTFPFFRNINFCSFSSTNCAAFLRHKLQLQYDGYTYKILSNTLKAATGISINIDKPIR